MKWQGFILTGFLGEKSSVFVVGVFGGVKYGLGSVFMRVGSEVWVLVGLSVVI